MDFVEQDERGRFDIVVLLQATTPLRIAEDVSACIRLVAEDGVGNAFTVTESHGNPYFNMVGDRRHR